MPLQLCQVQIHKFYCAVFVLAFRILYCPKKRKSSDEFPLVSLIYKVSSDGNQKGELPFTTCWSADLPRCYGHKLSTLFQLMFSNSVLENFFFFLKNTLFLFLCLLCVSVHHICSWFFFVCVLNYIKSSML